MSESRNFVSLVISGDASPDDVDDYVDRWHENSGNLSLHDYLGMSKEEYELWLTSPDSLPAIIESRKLNRPLHTVANGNP